MATPTAKSGTPCVFLGILSNGGEGGILVRPSDPTPSKPTKSVYLHEAKCLSRVSIRSRGAAQICPVLSKNRHQTDTKPTPTGTRLGVRVSKFAATKHPPPWCLFWCRSDATVKPDLRVFSNLVALVSCRLSHRAAPEACSSATNPDSAVSPHRLDQNLRRYVEFLVQAANHVKR